jgi:hypothetical protein
MIAPILPIVPRYSSRWYDWKVNAVSLARLDVVAISVQGWLDGSLSNAARDEKVELHVQTRRVPAAVSECDVDAGAADGANPRVIAEGNSWNLPLAAHRWKMKCLIPLRVEGAFRCA